MSEITAPIFQIHDIEKEMKQQRKDAAIVFIDLTDSTKYKELKGMEDGIKKVILFVRNVASIINKHGKEKIKSKVITNYKICKFIGDEVMVYYEGKSAPLVAVNTSIKIQEFFKNFNLDYPQDDEKCFPKIGIDFGPVHFAKFNRYLPLDPYGSTVDRAARIISLAQKNQILISESVYKKIKSSKSLPISKEEKRQLKGIKTKTGIYSIIWDECVQNLGIKYPDPQINLILSENVKEFVEDTNLLFKSDELDFILYTLETISDSWRPILEDQKFKLNFRILIRNPLDLKKDKIENKEKSHKIIGSITSLGEISRINPNINFHVLFYQEAPLLRLLIFKKNISIVGGLLGIYEYKKDHVMKFIGAENQNLLFMEGKNPFENYWLNLYRSRFEYLWDKNQRIRAFIFDLDGVVLDSMPFYFDAWRTAFQDYNIDISEYDVYSREGQNRQLIAEELYKEKTGKKGSKSVIASIIKRKEQHFHENFKMKFIPGIKEIIQQIKKNNFKIGLVTGSSKKTIEKIKSQDEIFSSFDIIISGDDVKNGKPAPEPYLKAIEKIKLSAEDCFVIENAPLGIISAKKAQTICLAVKGPSPISISTLKEAGADFVYDNIEKFRDDLIWIQSNIQFSDFISEIKIKDT